MPLLCQVLKKNGTQVGPALVSKMIKTAGYKLRKAKVVLTSNDPNYREKLARIHSILSNLKSNEAFFSIDEYGPFAIRSQRIGRDAPRTMREEKSWAALRAFQRGLSPSTTVTLLHGLGSLTVLVLGITLIADLGIGLPATLAATIL